MNKIKKFAVVLIILILAVGCGTKENSANEVTEVTDNAVKNIIYSHIISIEKMPKTIKLYKKDEVKNNDYSNEDLLHFGLVSSIGLENDIDLTDAEIATLKKNNITGVLSYINVSDIEDSVNDTFGAVNLKYINNVSGCPSFIFNASKNIYYVNSACNEANNDKIISYIDNITKEGNLYYATVYAGLLSNNKVYNNVNKSKEVATLNVEESYEITKENKDKFTKYTYTFTKNSDGKYVFTSIKK